jgi:hypothetical protein
MRENCTSGTARGVPGNRHSYRGEIRSVPAVVINSQLEGQRIK